MIRVVPDVVAPLATAGINIVSRTAIPNYHDWVIYGLTGLGYVAGWMGWGGDFVKQMAVSSLPLTVDKIYERVRGGASRQSTQRLAMRQAPVTRYPAPAMESQMAGVRLI